MPVKPDSEQSDKWDFHSYQEELLTAKGVKSGIHAVVREDTGAVIGQYKGQIMLPYKQLAETFDTALTAAGFQFTRSFLTTGNGARFWGKYNIGNGLHIAGEAYEKEIFLQSSHNGTLSPGFSFAMRRLACLNGMVGMAEVFAIFKRHSANLDLGFIANSAQTAIESGAIHAKETVERMGNLQLGNGQARNVLSNLVTLGKNSGVSPRAGLLINHNWENPSEDEKPLGNTMFRLYNAATRFCRDVDKIGRFELSRRANTYITGAFDLAVRRSTDLEKLLAVPAEPLEFDSVSVLN